jgi:HK97 family phage prohead protease
VALWAHDSSAPPVGRASNVLVENERLMGDITFADAETYAFADTVYRLVKGKFLNAVSVGFLPVEYDWSQDDERKWGIDFKVQDLLEISVCPVPANPNALGEARAKGIDTRPLIEWAERALDGGGKLVVPKAEIERLRKAAKEPPSPRRRDGDGLSETDPGAGGSLVATCARNQADECGMSDPQECAVHRSTENDEKRIARLVARGVRAEIKRLGLVKAAPRRRDAQDGDPPDGEMAPEHEESIRKAMDHLDQAEECFKDADDLYDQADDKHDEAMDHHSKAMDALSEVRDAIDDDNDEGGETDPDDDKAVARRLRRAKRLAAQHNND